MKVKMVLWLLALSLLIPAVNAGHTVPAPMGEDGIATFYLTPSRGGCTNVITLTTDGDITIKPDKVTMNPDEKTRIKVYATKSDVTDCKIKAVHQCKNPGRYAINVEESIPVTIGAESVDVPISNNKNSEKSKYKEEGEDEEFIQPNPNKSPKPTTVTEVENKPTATPVPIQGEKPKNMGKISNLEIALFTGLALVGIVLISISIKGRKKE